MIKQICIIAMIALASSNHLFLQEGYKSSESYDLEFLRIETREITPDRKVIVEEEIFLEYNYNFKIDVEYSTRTMELIPGDLTHAQSQSLIQWGNSLKNKNNVLRSIFSVDEKTLKIELDTSSGYEYFKTSYLSKQGNTVVAILDSINSNHQVHINFTARRKEIVDHAAIFLKIGNQ